MAVHGRPSRRGTRLAAHRRGRALRTRRILLFPVATLATQLAVGSAGAGTLSSATWATEWRGVYGQPVTFGAPLTASGTSTASGISVSLAVSAFSGSVPLTGVPLQSPIATLTLNGAQLIAATTGMAGATTGIAGAHRTMVPQGTVARVPLQVGVDALFTGTFSGFGILHYFTLRQYAWTPGTLTLTGLTSNLAPLPDVIVMGSFDLTAKGGGTVTLVSPAKITDQSQLPYKTAISLTELTLHFVPEPGALLLFGAGAVAMLGAARRSGARAKRDYGKTT